MEENRPSTFLRGRGAQINPADPFAKIKRGQDPVDWEMAHEGAWADDFDWHDELRTEYIETHPKTIINKVESPDIPSPWSMNPYQGCEHGCIYCYARATHPYWGYSSGLDFETKILVKKNAAALLEEALKKPSWKAAPIMFAGNTDVYQPAEKKFKITRACLEVFYKYRHPVSIITKNSLVLRDLDLLKKLAAERLVHVALSITTLNEELRRFLEPRTASVAQRLKTVQVLAENDIPVFVMMAPIIPSLNDHEIIPLVKKVAELGALGVGHIPVRLNGDIAVIFEDWLRKTMPDRADKVLNKIRSLHGGNLFNHRTGDRMRGDGQIADIIRAQFKLARERHLAGRRMPEYDLSLHEHHKSQQLKLF